MSPRNPFETLQQFHKAVSSTSVSIKGQPAAGLMVGLNLAVEHLKAIKKSGNKAIFIGNGGSSAIASHQSLDLWNHGKIRAISFSDASLLTCMANDFGYENVYAQPLEMFCDPGDLIIAISSSGKSPNILNSVRVAAQNKCTIIGLSGFDADNPLSMASDLHFYVPSHSYGVVEAAHLLLCHTIIDEFVQITKPKKTALKKKGTHAKRSLPSSLSGNAPHKTN